MNNDFRDKYKVPQKRLGNEHRFTSKDDVRAMAKKDRQKRIVKRRLRLASISLALGILLGAAGYHEVQSYRYQNSPITLAGSIDLGNTPEELGISSDSAKEIQDLKLKLKYLDVEKATDEQVTDLAQRVENLQFDIIKSKVSKQLNVKDSDITLHPSKPDDDINAYVYDEKNEKRYGTWELFAKTGLSGDIGNLINELGSIQDIERGNSKESNKDKVKDIIGALNNIDKFAGAKVSLDNGEIVVKYTKIKEINAVDKGKEIGE